MTAALDLPGASLRGSDLMGLQDIAEKLPAGPAASSLMLIPDFRPSMLQGRIRAFRSVAAAEALTLLGWWAIKEGGQVALRTLGAGGGISLPFGSGTLGMTEVISGLVRAHDAAAAHAQAGQLDDMPLDRQLASLAAELPAPATIALASGFSLPGAGLVDGLEALARRHALRLIEVTDHADGPRPLPAGGRLGAWEMLQLDAGEPPEIAAPVLFQAFARSI